MNIDTETNGRVTFVDVDLWSETIEVPPHNMMVTGNVMNTEANDEQEQSPADFRELSKEDEEDEKDIVNMFGNDKKPAEPCCSNECNTKIPKELAIQHRYTFQELEKKEKDLVILGHLQQHRRITALNKEYAKLTERKPRSRKSDQVRQLIHYYFCDLQICKKMYFFIHDLGNKEFQNIIKHYDEHGLTPRIHKLKSSKPKRDNVVTVEQIEEIVAYIKTYGEQFGRKMPHRTAKINIPKFKNYVVVGLPENVTKTAVYNEYCQRKAGKLVAMKTFNKVWNTYCPYIITLHRPTNNATKQNDVNSSL